MALADLSIRHDPADSTRLVPLSRSHRVLGFAIMTLIPALFWTLLVASLGYAFGLVIATTTLVLLAVSIFLFLAIICASIIAVRDTHTHQTSTERSALHLGPAGTSGSQTRAATDQIAH